MPQRGSTGADVTPSEEQLRACCAADAWLAAMQAARPVYSLQELLEASDAAVRGLDDAGLDQALAAHPRIGEPPAGEGAEERWSRSEQAAALAAGDDVQRLLAAGNRRYEELFGHVFLIRAAGRSPEEVLAALTRRLGNVPATEREVVRGELADIVALRLRRCVEEGER